MKAFLLLVFLFLLLFLIGSSSLANVDLTNSGTVSQGASVVETPQVISIQDNTASSNSGGGIPVTGGCSDPYTVQSGETLSQIAANCNTTLAAIRLSNPDITNANLIYAGQQIRIPNGNAQSNPTSQATPIPVTGNDTSSVKNQSQVVVTSPNQQTTALGQPLIRPGTSLQVKAFNYPPNTPVNIAIGPKAAGYNVVAAGITGADGTVVSNIVIPTAPDTATPWVVVVVTTGQPVVQGMSQPFYIAPAP